MPARKKACPVSFAAGALVLTTWGVVHANAATLSDTLPNGAPREAMMAHYLEQRTETQFEEWRKEYEARKSPEAIETYQQARREYFKEAIGGLPARTPLNARVTGTLERPGYTVEKVLFESRPDHYVTANLYLPHTEKFSPPYPGVVVACGHSSKGKAYEMYQKATALLALNGMAGLIFDPICQGERNQLLDDEGKPIISGSTTGHTLIGLGSILLGRNTARFEIWDGMRAIDYLQSRDEVQDQAIGFMGNSGGGTQTAYMLALEDRINAASPACYITSFPRLLATIGPQDAEQVIYNQVGAGMDHADYLMMRAPTPVLICAATQDFFDIQGTWSSFRYAKRLFTRLGYPERVGLVEHDADHGYRKPLREAAVQWMQRWLADRDAHVTEPEIEPFDEEALQVTRHGQTLRIDDAMSAFNLNQERNEALARKWKRLWENEPRTALKQVRKISKIAPLESLPEPKVQERGTESRETYELRKIVLKPEPDIFLPAALCIPSDRDVKAPGTLLVHEDGIAEALKPGGPVEALVRHGHPVLAVDLRGTGETEPEKRTWYQPRFGTGGQDIVTAYLLGESYIGMRAEDILMTARWLSRRLSSGSETPRPVRLVATGHVAQPALHAAALEQDLFQSVHLREALISWTNLVNTPISQNQLVNVIHGALEAYDLPRLRNSLGDKLEAASFVNAKGERVE